MKKIILLSSFLLIGHNLLSMDENRKWDYTRKLLCCPRLTPREQLDLVARGKKHFTQLGALLRQIPAEQRTSALNQVREDNQVYYEESQTDKRNIQIIKDTFMAVDVCISPLLAAFSPTPVASVLGANMIVGFVFLQTYLTRIEIAQIEQTRKFLETYRLENDSE